MKKKENYILWLFLLPSLCGFLLFLLMPWGYSLLLTFFGQSGSFQGLQSYAEVSANSSFQLAFFNTLRFMLISIPLLVLFCLMLGLFVLPKDGAGIKQKALRSFCLVLPMIIPSASVSVICGEIFKLDGLLNRLLNTNIDFLISEWSFYLMVIIFLWRNAGIMALLISYGYHNIPTEYYDNVKMDTQSKWLIFKNITWIYLRPTFFFILIFSVLAVFRAFQDIYLLFGRYPHNSVYMLQHYLNNLFFSLDYTKLCTACFLTAIFIYIITELLRRWG